MAPDGWEFHNPVKVIFGVGRVARVGSCASGQCLVVTTRGTSARGLTARVVEQLDRPFVHERVTTNPTIVDAEAAIATWRGRDIETIIAIGGGSAIDVAKVLSLALAAPDLTIPAWLAAPERWSGTPPVPVIAIPTTAGTGSEVTPFATLWDGEAKRKHSVGTRVLHPTVAIVDPELAVSLPWEVTLSTGLDAYSQCFEAICNRSQTPITTAIAERGLLLAPGALRTLQRDPTSLPARSAMAEAALLSGLAIAVTRTGLAHSMSYPITARLGLPHGLACALALPGVLHFNADDDDGRLAHVASLMGHRAAGDVAAAVLGLYRELGVMSAIRSKVPGRDALRNLEAEMLDPRRADNNTRRVRPGDLAGILDFTGDWLAAASDL